MPPGRAWGALPLPLPGAPARERRLAWMDVMRGTAILLVVVHHATVISEARGGVAPSPFATALDEMLGPVRMPAMVLLSGLLVPLSAAKGARGYVTGKAEHLLYAFVVWSGVYYLVLFRPWRREGGVLGNDPLSYLVTAPSPLWFVGFLLCFYAIWLVLRPVPPLVVVPTSLLLSLLAPTETRVERFFLLYAFFAVGAWAVTAVTRRHDAGPRGWVLAAAMACSLALTAGLVLLVGAGVDVRYEAQWAWVVLGAVVVFAVCSWALAQTRVSGLLAFLGRQSFAVYLAHYPAVVVAVAVSSRLDGLPPAATPVAACAAGLAAGAGLAVAVQRWAPAALLLRPPRRPARGVSRQASTSSRATST